MTEIAKTSALLAQVFPGTDVSSERYLSWLYERSPFGEVIETNLDDERGRAGHYALVPIVLTIDSVDRRGALSLNTAVHERARGGGAFVRLASETIGEAAARGVYAVIGVANANSTPGFLRRLDFRLVCSLPAGMVMATPGSRGGLESEWFDPSTFLGGQLAAETERLLAPSSAGVSRRWTTETLAWRLGRPGGRYALHRGRDVLAISCVDRRHGVPVAVLLKLFARAPLGARARRALVRAVCLHHRAPMMLHVGISDLVRFGAAPLPQRLRPSPLNLIYRGLAEPKRMPSIARFELLDFDAY